jgi:hypothetical protein
MSRIVRFGSLDGFGEEAVDLEQCPRRLAVGRALSPGFGPSLIDETTLHIYYLTPDGRWILGLGGIRQLRSGGEGYLEVHPVCVAHDLLLYKMDLPPKLEPYRHQASEGYSEWLSQQQGGMLGSAEARKATLERHRKASEKDPTAGAKQKRTGKRRAKKTTRPEKPAPPKTLTELAKAIRKRCPRKRNVPKFLELIEDQDEVDYDTIKDEVHGAMVEDFAVERTIIEARKEIIAARLPYTIHVSDRRVLKKPTR